MKSFLTLLLNVGNTAVRGVYSRKNPGAMASEHKADERGSGANLSSKVGGKRRSQENFWGLPPVEPPLTAVWGHGLRPPGCVPVGIWHSNDINIA